MTKKTDVSVIIPSYNVVSYIVQCLESVRNQTLENIEIICVDAKSTDGTLELIQDYAKKDSRFKVLISEKKSYGYQILALVLQVENILGLLNQMIGQTRICLKNFLYKLRKCLQKL